MNNVVKKYILENYVLNESTIQIQPGEKVLYQSPATELSMSGKFTVQQNMNFQMGRLLVTDKRIIFNGISTMTINTQGQGRGSQSYDFPLDGASAQKQKISIPEKIVSLGLQGPLMKLFGTGYVKISGNGGDRGYSVNNPNELIDLVNKLGK
jgi:hypothetical protein